MPYNDVKEVFEKMPQVFDPEAGKDLDAIFQFEITGQKGGNWYIKITDGKCTVEEGTHLSPTVTLKMSDETWLGIVNKELTGMQAFMRGKLNVKGDLLLAQKIEQLFPL
jgi:putative sterol carrier protein